MYQDLISIRHGDATKVDDLDRASVIFIYLNDHGPLEPLLKSAHERGVRILSNMFSLKYLGTPADSVVCNNVTRLYLYDKNAQATGYLQFANSVGSDNKERREEKEGEEETWMEWLQRVLDPLKNPLVMKVFNGSMGALVAVLFGMIYTRMLGIHPYNILVLTICLTVSVNWFVKELGKIVAEERAREEQERSMMKNHDKKND